MIIEAHYLPSIEYFVAISNFEVVTLEVFENYQKQSYRNRCKILTTNKIDELVVPVVKPNTKEIIKNIKIDYTQEWPRRHLGAIKAAYGKAPFFEHFYEYFKNSIERKPAFLIDLNVELLSICLKLLRIKKEIIFSDNYQEIQPDDFRGLIHPKKTNKNTGFLQSQRYTQNFGEEFVPNLSIVDLLMCQGTKAMDIINRSNVEFEHI